MYKVVDSEDSMFLIPDAHFQQFYELCEELDYFTLVLPIIKDSYQRTITILDIWYILSTHEIDIIENPENAMFYPYRKYFLYIINSFQMKRYIQLAMFENERLAFICAIYLYMELDEFVSKKMELTKESASNFKALQEYNARSIRPYFDLKFQNVENYPRQLVQLQTIVTTDLQNIYSKYKRQLDCSLGQAIVEAENIYEAVFGLINDWGGRVP